MGRRTLEIVLVRADSLPRQPVRSRMCVAATAWISSPPYQTKSTWPDYDRDVNPEWNEALYFTLEYSATFGICSDNLNIQLHNIMPNQRKYYVGGVQIPLRNWIELAGNQASTVPVYQVFPLNWGGNIHLYYRLGPYNMTGAALLPWIRAAPLLINLSGLSFLPVPDIDIFN